MIEAQRVEGEALMKQLKEAGKTDEEIHTIIRGKGYLAPTLSKLFRASSHKLVPTPLSEDQGLAKDTMTEKRDARANGRVTIVIDGSKRARKLAA